MSLLELFVEVDDFYQAFELWAAKQQLPSMRGPLCLSHFECESRRL